MKYIVRFTVLLLLLIPVLSQKSYSQQDTSRVQQDTSKRDVPDGSTGLLLKVSPNDYSKKKLQPNEFEGTYSTMRVGFGYIGDAATYVQDATFKQQMDSANLNVTSKMQTRDFRLMASGVFKGKRDLAWKGGFMYDGDKKIWLLRETGITLGVPELFGHIFVGRTKEGYSMVKVMNGHSPWTAERQMALDVIPILADGVKYFGHHPKTRIFWNLGYYNDYFSKKQSFSTYEWQTDARVGWLAFYKKEQSKVLHIAGNFRYGKPNEGQISLKSRPESNPVPYLINTGTFAADYSTHLGGEIYYSTGRVLVGSEVMVHQFNSNIAANHQFFGGDVVFTYLLTKTKRPYVSTGSIFGFVPVKKSVFKGGIGEWEAVLRFSYLGLDDGVIQGGTIWRITPMVNWYISRAVRMEFIYGYAVLERYDLKGSLQIFQARLQLTVL